VLTPDEIERFFADADVVISGNGRLRTPQIQGHEAAQEFSSVAAGEPSSRSPSDAARDARERGSAPGEALAAADLYMTEIKKVVIPAA
jgi:hypothetical protein